MRYSTSNPIMTQNFWSNITGQNTMTFQGTIGKLAYLLSIVTITGMISAYVALDALAAGNAGVISGLTWGGMLGSIVVAMMLAFIRPANPAPLMTIYAVLMGMFVGSISLMFEAFYSGIIIQAAFGTVFITGSMLVIYSSRVIRPTPTFNKIIGSLTMSIFLMYGVSILFSLLTPFEIPFLHTSGPIGIGITLFILTVAALSLISDFGFIESGVKMNAPKNAEWWGAFGVLVTIIWIYIEMIRLLSKLRD
ncbi:MAG: Bax inhibitor-1/YccA family protein [Candidatus Poseidoniaceae archaeon]|nr:Bax inhibitor-1/YccA family protein [Candidatus Poseidoniaceae archaeon]